LVRVHLELSSLPKFNENSYVASTLVVPTRPPGTAEKYFQWSLYLLLVTGFAALAGTGKLDFLSLAVVTPALAVRGYHLLKGKSFSIAERWTNYLTLLYLAVYAVDYFMLSQGFVSATVHLVLFIMVVKIFSVQRDRDLVYLAVLSFLMVLAAAVLTVDTLFLLTFGFFLLMAMSTFISMEVRRSERSAQAVGVAIQQERKFNRSLSGVAVLLSIGTLAGATVLFFILPRMSTGGGYLRNFGFQSSFVTGFSSEVRLGGIGQLQQSDSVVMHVQVLRGKLPPDIKWRGMALVNFDGQRWWNTVPEISLSRPLNNLPLDLSQLRVGDGPLFSTVAAPRASTLSYRIIMEPIGSYIFFVAPVPERISGPYDQIVITQQGSLYFNSDTGKTIGAYYAEADTRDPAPWIQNSNSRDYPPGLELMYRQLPSGLDPRIPSLAQQITASATSNYARARAIESYLKKKFGYTLQLPGRESDPIANFLFERKKGHCEYFASSMAVMLRALGIPARVINGFRGGAFNDLNNSYIVRSKDAHSWVEVYFPEYGWATFDPTPGGGAADLSQSGTWARLALYMDVLRETWREWVINYDFSHQVRLSYELNNQARNVQGKTRYWVWRKYRKLLDKIRHFQGSVRDISGQSVALIGVLVLLIVLLPLAPRAYRALHRTRMRKNPQRAPKHVASFWYARMLKLMERKGVRKSPAQTPSEFAAMISDPLVREDVVNFTDHYERARFDESIPDAQRLPQLYEALAGKGR
jgi:transglutaminase-like putative cysteine protease